MQRAKRYYVIKENGEWKVKLEKGRVLRTFGTNRKRAIKHAKKLGRRNNRPVMVNYADGATGAEYYSKEEL
jgi:ABC-type antimicrobial peptide transport system ATPase subunit